jgi:beta-xylosidase
MDFPDPDVIRVGEDYYMASTTMHFMPGAAILHSRDLLRWSLLTYVYRTLEDTEEERLEGERDAYGKGMWASSLRHHNGFFYLCFCAYDTGKTYLFRARDITGPWEKSEIDGFFHDASLLFDDDGKTYLVYGNRDIRLTELDATLSGPKPGGLNRIIVSDSCDTMLGYEGSHIYKINGYYYVFLINWPSADTGRRTQSCFRADSLTGEFTGGVVLCDDAGYHDAGIAQGGIFDTPDGDWYAMLFQDRGAAGRMPFLVPVTWKDDFPVFGEGGKMPRTVSIPVPCDAHPRGSPLFGSDDFASGDGQLAIKPFWQWNHIPDDSLWSVERGGESGAESATGALVIRTDRIVPNVTRAINTLTQITRFPESSAEIDVDGSSMGDGDYCGIAALQGRYGAIALSRDERGYRIAMLGRPGFPTWPVKSTYDPDPGVEYASVRVESPRARLRVRVDYRDGRDEANFAWFANDEWKPLGIAQKLYFGLDHFTGCRFALFAFSTKRPGGASRFNRFRYYTPE